MSKLAKRWGIDADHFVVGYIGTHGMAHALESVLNAARLNGDAGIRFLFVGAGAEREKLLVEAKRLRLRNVVFVPAQPKGSDAGLLEPLRCGAGASA